MKTTLTVILALWACLCSLYAQNNPIFHIGNYTVQSGETLSIQLTASHFDNIVSTQFSVHWNSAVVQLITAEGDALDGAIINGNTQAGNLALSWADLSTQGVSITDGTALVTMSFRAIGVVGDSTLVSFSNEPVAIEIGRNMGNGILQTIDATFNEGKIIINSCTAVANNATTENISCYNNNDGVINLNTNDADYTYEWSNGQNTATVSNLPQGNYSVTITDAVGCSSIQSFTLTQPMLLSAGVYTVNGGCGQPLGSAQINNLHGGTAPYTVTWSNNTEGNTTTNLPAGNYTYTVTDHHNCTFSGSFVIQIFPNLTLQGEATAIQCAGENNGSIEITLTGGAPPYEYNWSNGATIQDLHNLSIGAYTLVVYDSEGCATGSTFNIFSPTPLTIELETSPSPSGATGTAIATPIGGTTPYNVSWSTGDTGLMIENLAVGEYSVTVTDNNNCISTATFSIGTTPVTTIDNNINIKIFPNPCSELLFIDIPESLHFTTFQIYTVDQILVATVPARQRNVNIGHLPKAMYFITTDNKVFSKKIIKL
ncbi:MAG: T9SS type A sorting domain-containing protein [Saprospiraceae bacterium]|nr:T9SS type A sorting domain-containing protein [Saprospiraceae bacterium]MBP7679848.1 T9SS type A sorting domain-containing protein [Saprospiraceae bacterium]